MRPSALLALSTPLVAAVNLWATHYSGHVYTLALSGRELRVVDAAKTCGAMPSWLTFDSEARVLYCTDEDGTADPSTHGSLTAYRAGRDGKLEKVATTETVGGGVNSVIYEGGKGEKFLAIAHYGGSALSTFSLPLRPHAKALQTFRLKMDHQGAVAQQDAPHPHEVFVDPTGSFVVSPDLGADLLRIYSIDGASGKLHDCPGVNVTLGSGPRHGVFWTDGTGGSGNGTGSARPDSKPTHQRKMAAVGKTMMYLVNEIGGTMMSFDVSYGRSGCLGLEKKDTLVPYPQGKMPEGGTPSGIELVGDAFYVSVRSDQGFAPNDSMVVLDRAKDGAVSLRKASSAYGKVPRTFSINRAGDLVAIGNQASATVAIVRRDRKTGDLGEQVAVLQVGEPGKVGLAEGLSSVIWDE